MRHTPPNLACLLTGIFVLSAVAGPEPERAPAPRGETVRGITLSTHTDGRDWGSDEVPRTLQDIKDVGAGWVAIHPYARIRKNGGVRFWPIDGDDPPAWLIRPIREAHARGLKILIKPHLAYWGSPFGWRGAIVFEQEEERARFWREYEDWIVQLAAATREADAFAVGTELDRMLDDEHAWRRIIRRVREQTRAPLTYAANWTDFEHVGFWDALDAIGIQAYFPLTDETDTSEAAIRRGWERWMATLREVSRRHNRNIVFTELGYNRAFSAPIRPWEHSSDGEGARAVQETCLRIALEAIEREPTVVGAFLWKWFPRPHSAGHNFQLATPGIKQILRETWNP